MGYVDLFASKLTPSVKEFINNYEEGILDRAAIARVLNKSDYPNIHSYTLESDIDYILFEIDDPITMDDISWAYRHIVNSKKELTKSQAMSHSIRRVLNIHEGSSTNNLKPNDHQWSLIKEFRRKLEIVLMAFRYFNESYSGEDSSLDVQRHGDVMLIKYVAV